MTGMTLRYEFTQRDVSLFSVFFFLAHEKKTQLTIIILPQRNTYLRNQRS